MPTTSEYRVRRLNEADTAHAGRLFALMSEVFDEDHQPPSEPWLKSLLARDDFWVFAAFAGEEPVGGITAFVLPMTRSETRELFIYDLAVRADNQRRGIGRMLVRALLDAADEAGVEDRFVPADNDDLHALDFYRALGGAPSPVTFFTFHRERT